ncbi:MAG: N-acetylmuramoyl-L-alanine amidase, partial [Pseudomonadota bacterium]|nr:N-acetylmuramoyl-L-alanine amidase [Pseudomonadota bacterium]
MIAAVCALAAVGAAATAAVVQHTPQAGVLKVRLGGDATQTRIVIELDHAATGKLLSGEGASRHVVVA